MKRSVILDTGPLVAMLNRRETRHEPVRRTLGEIEPPLLTCEAIVSEACFLLRRVDGGADAVLATLTSGTVEIAFDLNGEAGRVAELMPRYRSVPMSLADACLVRMAELRSDASVFTLDRDFHVYRMNTFTG